MATQTTTALAIETAVLIFQGAALLGRRRPNRGGCVVCGATTRHLRGTYGDHPLIEVSAALATARLGKSDTSPMCAEHWLRYLRFRRRYADPEHCKLLVWLLWQYYLDMTAGHGNTLVGALTENGYRWYHEDWRGDLEFYSVAEVYQFTADAELQTAIFGFFGFREPPTLPLSPGARYIERKTFQANVRYNASWFLLNEDSKRQHHRELRGGPLKPTALMCATAAAVRAGASVSDLMRRFGGVSASTIRDRLKDYENRTGERLPEWRRPRGRPREWRVRAPPPKAAEKARDRAFAVTRYKAGESFYAIARAAGVTPAAIRYRIMRYEELTGEKVIA